MPSYPTISCFCRYSAKTFTCIYKNTCTKMFAPRVLLLSALVCRDTITKYHRQGWSGLRSLKDSNFLSHSLAGLKARHQSVNLGPLPWVCSWLSSPCVLTWWSLWVCLCPHFFLLYGDQSDRLGFSLMTEFTLKYFFKDPLSSNTVRLWGTGGLDFNTFILSGHNSAPVSLLSRHRFICHLGLPFCASCCYSSSIYLWSYLIL